MNSFQEKEQDKTPKKLSEVAIGNLPKKGFKVIIIEKIKELGRIMNEQNEKEEVLNRKYKEEPEMKNTVTEIKKKLDGISSRVNLTDKQISKLEDSVVEITQAEQKKRKINKENWEPLQQHQACTKWPNGYKVREWEKWGWKKIYYANGNQRKWESNIYIRQSTLKTKIVKRDKEQH